MKILAGAAMAMALATSATAGEDLALASFAEQQQAMVSGAASSESLTRDYLERIEAMNRKGPRLNAVIALNRHALADARKLDAERKSGKLRGPLHGVPILLKDNIESWDGTPTTAGSLALKDNVPERDAPLVKRLTDAGAVILGKANLSEWANYRSPRSISGWSAAGGLVRNPHALDRGACGSSSGSGAAVAAGLAAGAVGTETDGSITCPATMNGVVGLKPTVGLVSRTHVVPISASQDTAGPMTRNVADAAAMLTALAGTDPADPATREADARRIDYLKALDAGALKGARIGVLRNMAGRHPDIDAAYDKALAALKAGGALLVEVAAPSTTAISAAEELVLRSEFKAGINAYLASTSPAKVKTRTLADIIAFNEAHAGREMPLFGQETFKTAQAAPGLDDPTYLKARDDARRLAGPEGIDKWLKDANVEALVAVSGGPAPRVDPVNGSRWMGSFSGPPAVAGYPHLTVPMGEVSGLPVGLSFIGTAWSDARLLSLGYAFEQATHARLTPRFATSVDLRPEIAGAYDVKP
ncbi:amidase [Phenylobacterium sp. LH3H17]|uniref:amidase n=1 Tax=Phenylobacterium sp. LH3H17 TaxID=2903901 RepID=UPI0020C96FF0|nr:amidase [Phenylobacterium sp. LH3H17]UTP38680.1 amidase [Phenylobacterium sp. LH3H17]